MRERLKEERERREGESPTKAFSDRLGADKVSRRVKVLMPVEFSLQLAEHFEGQARQKHERHCGLFCKGLETRQMGVRVCVRLTNVNHVDKSDVGFLLLVPDRERKQVFVRELPQSIDHQSVGGNLNKGTGSLEKILYFVGGE